MLYSPHLATGDDDRNLLKGMMPRYAARYYISGPERDAFVAQTVTALAEEPEVLMNKPVEKAIALTMDRLFVANSERSAREPRLSRSV